MSVGRGRGYLGRHRQRSPRPGAELDEDLAPLSPRPANLNAELSKETQKKEIESEMERKEESKERDKKREWEEKYQLSADDEAQLKELLTVEEQYAPLLTLLEQFSPGEDGIQFNRKLRHFETTVTNLCPDETRLQQAFATFRAAALQSASCARKLAAVGASFTRQQRQQLLRGALLNQVMQGTFSKLDLLERANPTYLINAANLMGDYFAEARLCNGNKVHILASPLLQYMRALLASDDIRAHRSLATQLMQNGRELLSVLAQELNTLSIEIRLRLLSPPPVNVIWLLLSADICLNKFLPLPNILQQFYASHLELNTDSDYSEVSYGSWKKEQDEHSLSQIPNQDLAEKVSQNLSQISLNHDEDTKPKLRPILGAGAGLLRQEQAMSVSQDTFETWTAKSSLTKRYDLNSWRQTEEEKTEETEIFNPTVLPPNVQNFNPVSVPDYPPPNVRYNNYPENFANYLQQGDGAYIQNQYQPSTQNFTSQGDFVPYQNDRPNDRQNFETQTPFTNVEKTEFVQTFPQERPMPEPVNNEVQKHASRRPIENWRKEKTPEIKDDPNRNKPKNWIRQRSKDNVNEEEKEDKFKNRPANRVSNRLNRRNSSESDGGSISSVKQPPKRHVTEVPRNHKYWDHDDRCDKDYNS